MNDEMPQERSKKTVGSRTRLLGDVVDPFSQNASVSLQDMLPQTCLYLPNVGKKRAKKQKQQKMMEISRDLNFSDDVMAFHCSHFIDYDKKRFDKTVYPEARHGRRKTLRLSTHKGLPPKHQVCHLRNSQLQNKLVHKPQSFAEIDEQMKQEMDDILFSLAKTSKTFRSSAGKATTEHLTQASGEWDEYVLALLSKSTATWLSDEISTGPQQARLVAFLRNRYEDKGENGKMLAQPKDDGSKRKNSKFAAEIEKVLTDAQLELHYSPSFTFPAAVGDKKLTSDNIFQQEMLAGAFPVRGKCAPRKSIVLDTNSQLKFEKKLQENFPEDPKKWTRERRNSNVGKLAGSGKVIKGLQRWNDLPELLQVCVRINIIIGSILLTYCHT